MALTLSDAQRLGFDAETLVLNRPYNTANGVVYGASVRLGEVSVGTIILRDVAASVSAGDLNRSLLGMSFLGRLASYEVARETLTLRQ